MTDVVVSLAVVFVAAAVLLLVANHFSLPSVPFYILAGLFVGVAGLVEQTDLLELAQWGIAFLVFVFGTRVDFEAFQSVLRDAEGAAITQLLVVAPIAYGVGVLLGLDGMNALYFAIAAVLTSTLVGGGLLESEIRNNLVYGRLAASIHFFDDLVAIGLVLVLSAGAFTADAVTSQIGYGVLFLLAALVIYRHGFPILARLADGSAELVLMGSISILIAFLAAAEYAGISIVVGAFAAGIAIRTDGIEALDVQNGIRSIRDFFVAIFFVTVGALVTISGVQVLVLAAALVGLVVVVNPLVMMVAFTYEGYDPRTGFLASTSLDQVSEFSLVIVIMAALGETPPIDVAVFEAIILAAAVTMILTAAVRRRELWIYRRLVEPLVAGPQTRKIDERSSVTDDLADHVVIVGYGRHGRYLVEVCEEHDQPYVVIENDPVAFDEMRANCRNYVFGDAMATYPWKLAAVERADLVISTIDHRGVSETILEREADADVILRAGSSATAREYLDRGALFVNVTDVLAADRLSDAVWAVHEVRGAKEDLATDHRDRLEALEQAGFGSRLDD